jgi:hypothetical protein
MRQVGFTVLLYCDTRSRNIKFNKQLFTYRHGVIPWYFSLRYENFKYRKNFLFLMQS